MHSFSLFQRVELGPLLPRGPTGMGRGSMPEDCPPPACLHHHENLLCVVDTTKSKFDIFDNFETPLYCLEKHIDVMFFLKLLVCHNWRFFSLECCCCCRRSRRVRRKLEICRTFTRGRSRVDLGSRPAYPDPGFDNDHRSRRRSCHHRRHFSRRILCWTGLTYIITSSQVLGLTIFLNILRNKKR
jgi:hypothetical protein